MRCPNCRTDYGKAERYCRQCGHELEDISRSIVTTRRSLPTTLAQSAIPRRVAAGVGALALGVGIEIVRRNLLARLLNTPQAKKGTRAIAGSVKDLIFHPREKTMKLPKGHEMQETIVYVRRSIRRVR